MLSIITPSFERRAMLERALESASDLESPYEHIVVDGGSHDGTVELLRERGDVRWTSGPDRGMYDALNTGLGMATGSFVMFLNSDDRLVPEGVETILAHIEDAPAACGDARIVDPSGKLLRVINDSAVKDLDSLEQLLGGTLALNARIFRRETIERIGPFDPSFQIAGDREWLLRAQRAGISYANVEAVVYEYQEHGGSLTFQDELSATTRREHLSIALRERRVRSASERRIVDAWSAWELRRLLSRRRRDGDVLPVLRDLLIALRLGPDVVRSALRSDVASPLETTD